MPSRTQQLGLFEARALIADSGFGVDGAASHRPTIGVELESFTVPAWDPARLPTPALPAGSRLTFEPGGQVELSSPPANSAGAACDAVATDLAVLREAFSPLGVQLVQRGLSACPPGRIVDRPRYRAMEAYFDTAWPEGRRMMCATAAVQVNVGLGGPAVAARRWRAGHVLGPVLAAAFTSSPVPGRWANARLATWLILDPSRTAPVCANGEPADAWADYALDARVMLIRVGDDYRPVLDGPLTARDWVLDGHSLGWPTSDDLSYHLTTLFPPIRPKRWLELRMIDALPDPWWRVPVAVATAWLDDPDA
ncbi:MAG TPA: glutamate-cysteine ligase family protein, partial [Acidimicrobiales bacterium]|nr:glutamate-cysteine ligase family protein [Acidimicrobiales bacterium]